MEKLLKIIIASFISLGGVGVVSQINQAEEKKENINITVTPNQTQTTSQTENKEFENARETALNKIQGTIRFEYVDEDYIFIIEKDNKVYEVEVDKIYGNIDDIDILSYDYAITLDKAKSIALSEINGTIKKIEIHHDEYKFEIEKDNVIYKIEINYSGNIKKIDSQNKQSIMSLDEAKKIALKKVNGTIKYVEEDDDEYNIYIEKDQSVYELEIDKYTGQIKDIDQERLTSQNVINFDEAKKIALKNIDGVIKDFEYDHDDCIYEMKIVKNGIEYEIEMDAVTGHVISIEKDD